MATIRDLTKAIIELKKHLTALEAENARLKADVASTHEQAYALCKEVVDALHEETGALSRQLQEQRTEIEALKAERVIVREDGSVDHEAMALQALDLMSKKFEHIDAEIKSLDQAVTSLNSFRNGHLLDHEAEESKRREFTSYFDKHPGDRANI